MCYEAKFPKIEYRLKFQCVCVCVYTYKGKAILLQAWSGPEGSTKLRFLDYMTTAQGGGNVVSLTYRPPLSEDESTPGP
jgi:hypothetical protein